MFVSESMICNDADVTTINACDYKDGKIIRKLENDITILSK